MQARLPAIKQRAETIIREAIYNSETYQSLLFGELRRQLGLTDPGQKVGTLIDVWVSNIEVRIEYKAQDRISILLNFCRSDLLDVLGLEAARQVTEKGQELEWLAWLLLEDGQQIIDGYYYKTPNAVEEMFSRAGGLMRKKDGAKWIVPDEFQGNINNNWITRVCDQVGGAVLNAMKNEILR